MNARERHVLLSYLHEMFNTSYSCPFQRFFHHYGERIGAFNEIIKLDLLGGRRPKGATPLLLQIIILFSVYDSLIDNMYPYLEGLSSNEKYKKLPSTTPVERIRRQAYRILRLMRNKAFHVPSKVDESEARIEICDSNDRISISKHSLREIRELLLIFLEYDDLCDKFFELIVMSYFREIRHGISEFSDTLP
jgi:hypothetical protein